MKISPSEFRDALTKGTGRAVAYVRNAPAAEVRDALLDACLHCKVYDPQFEGMRSGWLYHLIELTGEPEFYRRKILDALSEKLTQVLDSYSREYWREYNDYCSRYQLTKQFALRGDEEARTLLYREFDEEKFSDDFSGGGTLFELDGLSGMLHVLEAVGQRVRQGLDMPWWVRNVVQEAGEKFGEDFVRELIEREAAANEFIQAFLDYKPDESAATHYAATAPQKPFEEIFDEWLEAVMADAFDDPELLETKDEDMVRLLSRRHNLCRPPRVFLNEAQVDRVWEKVLAEENPYRLFCLACAFSPIHKYSLPYAPKILALVDSPRCFLQWQACQMMSQIAYPDVRRKALELLQTVPSKVNWYAGIELLANSFQPEDSEVIDAALLMHEFPDNDELHSAGTGLYHLVAEYPEGRFTQSLRWFFEHTPCSTCRYCALDHMIARGQTTREMLEECLDDSNEEIRELAASVL